MRFITPLLACLLFLFLPASAHAAPWAWPVKGEVLTRYLNGADPYAAGQHRGIDVAAPVGTAVAAAHAGTVTFAGVAGSSGRTVSVRTDDGAFDASYLHLDAIEVAAGEHVSLGARLGSVGTSGRRSAAEPHLHFGVREAGTDHGYVDPLGLLPPPPSAYPPELPPPVPAPLPVPALPPPLPSPETLSPAGLLPPAGLVPAEAPAAAPGLLPWPVPAQVGAPVGLRPTPEPALAVEPGRRGAATPVEPVARPGGSPSRTPDVVHTTPAREAGPSAASAGGAGLAGGVGRADSPSATGGPPRQGRVMAAHASRKRVVESGVPYGPRSPEPYPRGLRTRSAAASPSDNGADIGWIAACVALLVLSAALGRPGRGGGTNRRGSPAHAATGRFAGGEPVAD